MATSLRDRWAEVVASIGALSNYYELGNILLSLGTIGYLRRRASRALSGCGMLVDLGAGPGNMARAAGCGVRMPCVLVDAVPVGLRAAPSGPLVERVVAMYEWLPLRDGSMGCASASFSLRDSWSAGMSIHEARRILRPGGGLVILDLGKPDSIAGRIVVGAYWRLVSRILGGLMGPLGPLYSRLRLTYDRLPRNGFLVSLLREVFDGVSAQELLGGGVVIIEAVKAGRT